MHFFQTTNLQFNDAEEAKPLNSQSAKTILTQLELKS